MWHRVNESVRSNTLLPDVNQPPPSLKILKEETNSLYPLTRYTKRYRVGPGAGTDSAGAGSHSLHTAPPASTPSPSSSSGTDVRVSSICVCGPFADSKKGYVYFYGCSLDLRYPPNTLCNLFGRLYTTGGGQMLPQQIPLSVSFNKHPRHSHSHSRWNDDRLPSSFVFLKYTKTCIAFEPVTDFFCVRQLHIAVDSRLIPPRRSERFVSILRRCLCLGILS